APTKAWTVLVMWLTEATAETAPDRLTAPPLPARLPPTAWVSIDELSRAVRATLPPAATGAECCTNAWMVSWMVAVDVELEAATDRPTKAPATEAAEPSENDLMEASDRAVRVTSVPAMTPPSSTTPSTLLPP